MTLRNRWRTKWFTREHLTILALLGLSYLSVNQYFAGRAKWVHSPLDVGDWLINYQGGFVRRGLVGQLFYWLTSSSHRDIGLLVMEFDALILLLLAATVSYLVVGSKNAWVSWVVLSPVAFAFSTYDTPGGFRKENLLFLALAFAAVATRTTHRFSHIGLGLATLVYLLALFSWEPSAFSLPVAWWIIGQTRLPAPSIRRWRAVWVGSAVIGFGLSVLFHGSPAESEAVCHSILSVHLSTRALCTGGISSISWTTGSEFTHVLSYYPKYLWYIPWYCLSFLPFLLSGWVKRHWQITASVVSLNSVLFLVGSDYGRWIHILAMSLALVWLTSPERLRSTSKRTWRERVALVLWISLWSAPWSGNPVLWRGLAVSAYRNISHPVGFYYPWCYNWLVAHLLHSVL